MSLADSFCQRCRGHVKPRTQEGILQMVCPICANVDSSRRSFSLVLKRDKFTRIMTENSADDPTLAVYDTTCQNPDCPKKDLSTVAIYVADKDGHRGCICTTCHASWTTRG